MYTVLMENGDLHIDDTGGQEFITGSDKAGQDVADVLLSPYDSSRDYGNEMFDARGTLRVIFSNIFFAKDAVALELRSAISRLIAAQRRSPVLPVEERITRIKTLIVRPNANYTDISFFLSVEVDQGGINQAYRIQLAHLGPPVVDAVGGLSM